MPELVQVYFKYALALGCLLALALLIQQLLTLAAAPPSSGMPGMWRTAGLTGYQGAKKV